MLSIIVGVGFTAFVITIEYTNHKKYERDRSAASKMRSAQITQHPFSIKNVLLKTKLDDKFFYELFIPCDSKRPLNKSDILYLNMLDHDGFIKAQITIPGKQFIPINIGKTTNTILYAKGQSRYYISLDNYLAFTNYSIFVTLEK